MTWRVATSLLALHAQLQAAYPAAAPPATAVTAWGTIGDANHTSTSDHSPKDFPGWGDDIVTACDFPHVPHLGLDAGVVTEKIRQSRDVRAKYVIFNRRIFSSYATSTRAAWMWGAYSNAATDPHTDHAHVSVVGDARADDTSPWQIGATMSLTPEQGAMLDTLHTIVVRLANGASGNIHPIHATASPIADWWRTAADGVTQLLDRQADVALTDEQLDALADRVTERLAGQLGQIGSALARAGAALEMADGPTADE